MSETTPANSDDIAAHITSIQRGLKRDLGEAGGMAETFQSRKQDTKAALNEALVEEQEAIKELNEEAQRSSIKK